ncbi:hypothetical protein [Sinorhizobium fredii]|nr:hypothetical protein [Sinorhizobium fredii]
MTDPALARAGMIGAVLAAICCAAPLVALVCRSLVLAPGWPVRVWWCFR